MVVKEFIDILEKIEDKDIAEIEWYLEDEEGETIDIDIDSMGGFSISADIIINFKKIERPIIKPANFKRNLLL